jgi:peptidoglycan/LPS O-acetylase OafA/YrhL
MYGILRTLLALFVVFLHIFSVPTFGNYAVTFFFVLSGFLMTLIMHNTYKFNFKGFTSFWLNRILRLYPTYIIILILSIFAIFICDKNQLNKSMFLPHSIIDWFSNITMIYFDIVPHRIKPRIVPTSWALTNELFFYFLISLGISKTFKRTLFWLGISILYFIGTYYFYNLATFRYSAIPASSLPFAIGAVLFWIKDFRFESSIVIRNLIVVLILLLLFYLNVIYFAQSNNVQFKELAIYLNYLIASSLILFLFKIKINSKFKKIDTYIGYFSYQIYLSHYLVNAFFIFLFKRNNVSFKLDSGDFMIYMIMLISFSFLIVHFVDIKVDNFKKSLRQKMESV